MVFAAPDGAHGGWNYAAFRVRDDGHLIVAVPDLGPAARLATILVVTPKGAAVTVPVGATLVPVDHRTPADLGDSGFFYVPSGATLTPPGRGAVVVVDRGAWVRAAAGSLVVLRSGGGAQQARTDCLIIRETPRPEARDLSIAPVLDVPAVNACFVDSLFQYSGQ